LLKPTEKQELLRTQNPYFLLHSLLDKEDEMVHVAHMGEKKNACKNLMAENTWKS
jgi:hypothetical protein